MNTESEYEQGPEALSSVESPWENLAVVRMEKGLTIEDVARYLRITEDYVLALEQGQFERLPAPAFARGYIKNYAKLLGLDGEVLAQRFDEGINPEASQQSFLNIASKPLLERRSSPLLRYALTLASVVAIAITSYYWWHNSKVASIPADIQMAASQESAVAPAASVHADTINDGDSGEPDTSSVVQESVGSDTNVSEAPAVSEDVAETSVEEEAAPVADTRPVIPAAIVSDRVNLYIRFKDDCWMEIQDLEGKVLMSGIKKAGAELDIKVPSTVRLRLGNAPAVETINFAGHVVDMSARATGKRVAKLTLKATEQT